MSLDEDDNLSPEDEELGRLVLAAFDTDAAVPLAAINGEELTAERELGNKMKRDKKD